MVASWTEVPFVKEAIGEVLQCARTYAVQADVATTPATDQSDAHMASSKLGEIREVNGFGEHAAAPLPIPIGSHGVRVFGG